MGNKVKPGRGVVLDDLLREIRETRKGYQLGRPSFVLKAITKFGGAERALDSLIDYTIQFQGNNIFSDRDLLREELGIHIQSKRRQMEAYSGCRVSPRLVEQTLKGVFQIVLQTITQLPMRDMKIGSTTAEFKRLASRLEALAWKSRDTLSNGEAAKRVALLFKSGDINQNRLLNVADELEWAARALRSVISNVRVSRPRSDSPNPQVRFALIFLHWLEVSTGQHHYAEFEHLLHAAFAAANKTAPKWVERLAIEMHSKLKRRKFHRIF